MYLYIQITYIYIYIYISIYIYINTCTHIDLVGISAFRIRACKISQELRPRACPSGTEEVHAKMQPQVCCPNLRPRMPALRDYNQKVPGAQESPNPTCRIMGLMVTSIFIVVTSNCIFTFDK